MKDRNRIRETGLMLAGLVLALLAVAYVPTAVAAPPACDCSCAARRQLEERGAGMAAKAEQAFNGGDLSAFMAMAKTFGRCMQQCMQPWQQCEAQAEAEQQTREHEAAEKAAAKRRVERWGAPRDDLARFAGKYQADGFRWVVDASKHGYLTVYPTKGDGAPLNMRSAGSTRFTSDEFGETIVAQFVDGALILHGDVIGGEGRFPRVTSH